MTALRELAALLRDEETPISPHVVDPDPARGFAPPGQHEGVVESVREGYLLHYGESRLLRDHDSDLALLAGDYLYALGIERLAAAGDIDAVAVLAELISRCAQAHAEGREDDAPGLWLGAMEGLAKTA